MKRLFKTLALMAVLNLIALAGLVGYAWKQGWLQRERILEAVAVLKGEKQDETAVAVVEEGNQSHETRQASEQIQSHEEADERLRIELTRREREIRDGWQLLEVQQLSMLREKEAIEAQKQQFKAQREQLARKEGDSGLQKEMDTLSGIDAKTAKELLRLKKDADVVQILMSMNQRKVNKIVKQCKTKEERLWIGRVMEKFHERNAIQAEVPGAGT